MLNNTNTLVLTLPVPIPDEEKESLTENIILCAMSYSWWADPVRSRNCNSWNEIPRVVSRLMLNMALGLWPLDCVIWMTEKAFIFCEACSFLDLCYFMEKLIFSYKIFLMFFSLGIDIDIFCNLFIYIYLYVYVSICIYFLIYFYIFFKNAHVFHYGNSQNSRNSA